MATQGHCRAPKTACAPCQSDKLQAAHKALQQGALTGQVPRSAQQQQMLGSRQAQPGGHEATKGAHTSADHPVTPGIAILSRDNSVKSSPFCLFAVKLILVMTKDEVLAHSASPRHCLFIQPRCLSLPFLSEKLLFAVPQRA